MVDEHDEDALIITRGIYDGQSDRAWTRISGFVQTANGLYERFEETTFNTVFDMASVRQALLEAGYETVHFAQVQDLTTSISEPEYHGRGFIIASKSDI